MQVRMTGGAGSLTMDGMPGAQSNFESDDRKKEEEEVDCTFTQEELDRQARN